MLLLDCILAFINITGFSSIEKHNYIAAFISLGNTCFNRSFLFTFPIALRGIESSTRNTVGICQECKRIINSTEIDFKNTCIIKSRKVGYVTWSIRAIRNVQSFAQSYESEECPNFH